MRGRALIRLVIVLAAVTGMMLAPVVTWPSSGVAPCGLGFDQEQAPSPTWTAGCSPIGVEGTATPASAATLVGTL